MTLFDRAQVEPTDTGCAEAARELASVEVDGYVALGGGSSIDTAKMLNLLGSHPGSTVHDYLNKPVGAGRAIPGPLKPLVAVPTTAGSGSECTAMVALGVTGLRVKTGISDPYLRPSLALVDPANTLTLPAEVTAASGYDVLTHACESYTARPYDRRPPSARPPTGRCTSGPTRSATSGPSAPWNWSGATCAGPCSTPTTSRPARR
ncbi:hypothetical protein GCM10020000_24420 [Streptomyces olivoverticillatus]